jgi:hypothetical protein
VLRVGLIQALGRMSSKSDIPVHIDLMARAVLFFLSAGLGLLAYYLYEAGTGLGFWAASFFALTFLVLATVAPRSLRTGIVSSLPWF